MKQAHCGTHFYSRIMLIIIVVADAASSVFVAIAFVAFSVVFFSQLLLFLLLSFAYFDFSSKKLSGRLCCREFSIFNLLFSFPLCCS